MNEMSAHPRAWTPTGDRPSENADFSFIDLFAGIGGLRRGFESIRRENRYLVGECVLTCEWDRYSRMTYSANFGVPEEYIKGDIRLLEAADIPDHDLLLAGFPCQPFSIAGVSKKNALNRPHGFACETQGTLFHDVRRILEARRPAAFVLENVKNLLNHDRGRTFAVIKETLDGLDYDWKPIVIDAKAWVPQHRERVFMVGFRRDLGLDPFNFDGFTPPPLPKWPRLEKVLHRKGEPVDLRYTNRDGTALDRYTLTDHLWNYLQAYAEKHRRKGNGFGFGLVSPCDITRTLSARYYKDGSEILVDQGPGRPPRRLTPRECAGLMGFDDDHRRMVIPAKVSDTQAYRQFGNSVVVPVVKAVAEYMEPWLRAAIAKKVRESVLAAVG